MKLSVKEILNNIVVRPHQHSIIKIHVVRNIALLTAIRHHVLIHVLSAVMMR